MDPFSVVIGTLQIVGQCGQVTLSLARYIHQVATVDQRIKAFYEDVAKLQSTFETLEQCRNSPQMIAAAKAADEFTEHLWSHLATTLRDCENTLVQINHVLRKINKPLGLSAHLRQFLEPPIKQLQEQLHTGELGRHHEKIRMFTTSLALPMQMINITLQLDQREMSEEHQRRLENRLTSMQRTINSLNANITELKQPQPITRSSTFGSGTLVEGQESEKAICSHMEVFANRARQFLSSASSVAASSRSGTSTVRQEGHGLALRGTSEHGVPLTRREKLRIRAWVPTLQEDSNTSPNGSEVTPSPGTEYGEGGTDDEEEFELVLVRTFFEHGQSELSQADSADYAVAEENFVETLNLLQKHDFGERLAFQCADVILMLTHCYVEQQKFEEAIELLLPLTDDNEEDEISGSSTSNGKSPAVEQLRKRPDRGRTFAAQHSLGNVYLKKGDLQDAERYSISAFKGRRRIFGKDHEKTIESAQLVVDTFTAKGERTKAKAYSIFLTPENSQSRRLSNTRQSWASTGSGPAPRPVITRKALPIERMQTSGTLLIPSPPLATNSTTRKASNDMHRMETGTSGLLSSVNLPSVFDDASTVSSATKPSTPRSTSVTPRHYLKPRFDAVKTTASSSKDRACEQAQHILKGYDPDPSRILIHRWDDIKKNIKKQGAEKGLASAGLGYAPIHFFCELKEEAVTEVELLIEDGVDLMAVRYRAGYGKQEPMTPLQLAIEKGHQVLSTMIIDALHASGTPMSELMALKDKDDLSPLLVACRRGQIDTVTRLLSYGAGVVLGFPRFWRGNSLLHDSCSRCDVDMVNLLLSIRSLHGQRADIGTLDQQDRFGRTPLMYAVISKNIPDQRDRDRKLRTRLECVELLLRHGGDGVDRLLAARDSQMMDVLAHARDEGDEQLSTMLASHSAGEGEIELRFGSQ